MRNNASKEYFALGKNGEKKKVMPKMRLPNSTEMARALGIFEPDGKNPASHIVPKLMSLESDYPRLFARLGAYSVRVYTDEDGREFIKRLTESLETVDAKKRMYRAAGLEFFLKPTSLLNRFLESKGVKA